MSRWPEEEQDDSSELLLDVLDGEGVKQPAVAQLNGQMILVIEDYMVIVFICLWNSLNLVSFKDFLFINSLFRMKK